MKFHIEIQQRGDKEYFYYKASYRQNGSVKNYRVYLGEKKEALKILADFNAKSPDQQQLFSYSGELLLEEIAKRLNFKAIINQATNHKYPHDLGEFIQILVIERILNPVSKWALANRVHSISYLSLNTSFKANFFTEQNMYRYMDSFQPYIHQIQVKLVEKVFRLFPTRNEVLILDGTSYLTYGQDPKETGKNEGQRTQSTADFDEHVDDVNENDNPIRRFHGYSRDKRPDLPQVNVMLGVNQSQIPLFFEVFSGNTLDLKMFERTLKRLQKDYSSILERIKDRYLIFDRGNLSPDTVAQLDLLTNEWQVHFISGALSSFFKKELRALEVTNCSLIFSQKKTKLYGQVIEKEIYQKRRRVLLYLSPAVQKSKLLKFEAKLQTILDEIGTIREKSSLTPAEKVIEIEQLIRKCGMRQLFELPVVKNGKIEDKSVPILRNRLYQLQSEQLEKKKNTQGEFPPEFRKKLQKVQDQLKVVKKDSQLTDVEKVHQIRKILKKNHLLRLYALQKFDKENRAVLPPAPLAKLYRLLPEKVKERKTLFGKFAILTSDSSLTAPEIIELYKDKELVEHEFHLFKSLLLARPINHWLSRRIAAHFALVHWGMMFLSILKLYLEKAGSSSSFELLLLIIKKGLMEKAIYSYPKDKSFQLTRIIGFTKELNQICKVLGIKPQSFFIEKVRLHSKRRIKNNSGSI